MRNAPPLPGLETPLALSDLDPLHGTTWTFPDSTTGRVVGTWSPPEGPFDVGQFGLLVRRAGVRGSELVELTADEARTALEVAS